MYLSPRRTAAMLSWLAITVCTPAQAQLQCTMPNGVTITRQIGDCPADAVKIVGPDGKQIQPKVKATTSTKSPPAAQPALATARPADLSADDYALLICKALEQSGATTCDVNSKMLSTSTIEATLTTTPNKAVLTCNELAAIMREKTKAFEAKDWKILIFSPYSGNRPIAACKL